MRIRLFLVLALTATYALAAAAEDFSDLAKRLPENVNAVGLIDLAALNKSPIAQASGWADKPEIANLPNTVGQLVVGGNFNPAAGLHEWRYGVARLAREAPMAYIAKKYGGAATTVGGHPAVISKQGLAFIELEKGLLGLHPAGSRQELSRWIRHVDASSSLVVNPYLADFIKNSSGAQIRFLLDTSDLFDPEAVKAQLAALKAVGDDKGKIDRLTMQAMGMKGIAYAIRAGDDLRGTLRLDFAVDAEGMAETALPVLKELLADQGLWLADFDSWKAEARGKSIYVEGKMTEAGLRQSLTILLTSPQSMQTMQPEEGNGSPNAAGSSRRYLNGVANLLDDLRKQMKDLRTAKEFAHWYDHTARKIDQLPDYGADEQLVLFAGTVSDKLRACAASIRGADVDFKKLATYKRSVSTVVPESGFVTTGYDPIWLTSGNYWYSYTVPRAYFANNYNEVSAAQGEVIAKNAKERIEVWKSIEADLGTMRQTLASKYGKDFDSYGDKYSARTNSDKENGKDKDKK